MAALLLSSLAGFVLGALLFDLSGAFAGAAFAATLAWTMQLAKRVHALEHDLAELRVRFEPARLAAQPTDESEPATTPPETVVHTHAEAELDFSDVEIPDMPGERNLDLTSPGPHSDNLLLKIKALVGRFFSEGNPVARTGMVVMFFGLGFLIKYAAGQGLFPVEMRLAIVAAAAIALIVVGWRTRHREAGYGLVLQGGGVGALYLTVFAATKLTTLLPLPLAFTLMLMIVAAGVAMAVLQNAQSLAIMASAGGFLAPVLTSDGTGSHIGLFSFYLLLNAGILAIALFKAWRPLNWVGFVFTFGITGAWCLIQYRPEHYQSAQLFIAAFFALYLAVSILFALRQPPRLKGLVDGSLVFGLPIALFGLQYTLLEHTDHGLELSAFVLAAVYLAVAAALRRPHGHPLRLLFESFLGLGILFATLAVPLALDAEWTSATWAIEATGLVWVGLRQSQLLPRLAGYLLYLLAAAALVLIGGVETGTKPLLQGDFIGLTILAASALFIAYLSDRHASALTNYERWIAAGSLAAGWGWWLLAGVVEIDAHLPARHSFAAGLLFLTISTVLFTLLQAKLTWQSAWRIGASLLVLASSWVALHALGSDTAHPAQGMGLLALAFYAAAQYWILRRHETRFAPEALRVSHIASAWLLLGLLAWEASWWQSHLRLTGVSALGLWFACCALPLSALLHQIPARRWPFIQQRSAYRDVVPAPLLGLLILWYALASLDSAAYGLLYIPLLNPLDAMQAAALLIFAVALRKGAGGTSALDARIAAGLVAVAGFIWVNLLVLRSIHHHTGVPFSADSLWASFTVQMALSILWALCALSVMLLARARQDRHLWFAGLALLGLVVLKLFTKDLTGTGTVARIVSFLAVGSLMLLIGYISPAARSRGLSSPEVKI